MRALDYILANYQHEKYKDSLVERAVLRSLVHALNKEELQELQKKLKRGSSKWSIGRVLYEETAKVLGRIQPHKNESISTLLKALSDRKSGKVAGARTELRDRFSKQSFQTQRKILKAMLSASKQDRVWAYKQLSNAWDDFFFEEVKSLWEKFHEKECGAVIIKHFPMEYVYDNLSLLDTGTNYTNLCIKLIHHPKFRIDKERLKEDFVFYGNPEVEELYILAKAEGLIFKGEATNILFRQMAEFINTHDAPPTYLRGRRYDLEQQIEERKVSTMHFDFVSGILWCMGELGLVDELIAFEEWDSQVKSQFMNCEELEYLVNADALFSDPKKELWNLYRQTIIDCLPSEYQQLVQVNFAKVPKPSIDGLINESSVMATLVEKFGLETV